MAKTKSKLGDYRLERVHGLLIDAMIQKKSVVLRQLGKDDSEEATYGRFINNKKISPDQIMAHYQHTAPLDFGGKHILVVEDSSSAAFGLHKNRLNLGYIGPSKKKSGFDMHIAIYMDALDGACYSLGGLKVWKTPFYKTEKDQQDKLKRRRACWKLPFESKERYKWYSVAQQAITYNPSAENYTIVSDCESDIYDLFARYLAQDWDWVIRSKTDRKLSDGIGMKRVGTLYKSIESWKVKKTYKLKLPKTDKRSAHEAKIDLKFGLVNIARPKSHPDKELPQIIPMYIVEAKEKPSTVKKGEKPIHWVILTSHPVLNNEQAMQIIQWYRWRWVIEQVFRTLKSQGLNIENSQVESYEGLVNLATLALISAVQVLQLVQARDGTTKQEIQTAFSATEIECLKKLNHNLEGKTEKSKNPYKSDSLAFAAWVIARLGGWKGYKKARPPGPITMLRGIIRFYNILEGFYLLL